MKKIILASASPRRAEILEKMGIEDFTVLPAEICEDIAFCDPEEYVMTLAKDKAKHIAKDNEGIIIAADTIVYIDARVLGKPKDNEDAKSMLLMLSGNIHSVYTGVCIISTYSKQIICDYEKTNVYFRNLSEEEIDKYIQTGEPMDKAGAYGIQGSACSFIRRIEGCYYNVMGLPAAKVHCMLEKLK